jgi:hypothetical protein
MTFLETYPVEFAITKDHNQWAYCIIFDSNGSSWIMEDAKTNGPLKPHANSGPITFEQAGAGVWLREDDTANLFGKTISINLKESLKKSVTNKNTIDFHLSPIPLFHRPPYSYNSLPQ